MPGLKKYVIAAALQFMLLTAAQAASPPQALAEGYSMLRSSSFVDITSRESPVKTEPLQNGERRLLYLGYHKYPEHSGECYVVVSLTRAADNYSQLLNGLLKKKEIVESFLEAQYEHEPKSPGHVTLDPRYAMGKGFAYQLDDNESADTGEVERIFLNYIDRKVLLMQIQALTPQKSSTCLAEGEALLKNLAYKDKRLFR